MELDKVNISSDNKEISINLKSLDIGKLEDLSTNNKSDIVSAINEIMTLLINHNDKADISESLKEFNLSVSNLSKRIDSLKSTSVASNNENGYITVNDAKVKAYDDSILEKRIEDLANRIADHSHSEDTVIDTEKKSGSNSSTSLMIDLEKWGIKEGIPNKPYSRIDYDVSVKNIEGINNALQYAFRNGFTHVCLPKGEYALSYVYNPTTYRSFAITLPSGINFDLNGSILKAIFDSDNKELYRGQCNVLEFNNTRNAHLMNGEIIGDLYERNFSDPSEKSVEHTYGVSFRGGSAYCKLSKCKVHGFMGDPVNFTAGGWHRGGFSTGSFLGTINDSTGELISDDKTNSLYTNPIKLPENLNHDVFSLGGQGYARTTDISNKHFDVYYYRFDNSFIGVLKNYKVQAHVPIPNDAAYFRFLFHNETNPKKNFNIFINYGGDCHHNVVEQCEIFNGHRGGITLGGSYNIIQNNVIRDNGKFGNEFLDGAPRFPDTTRYAINQEDSYGDNNVIRNNTIYGSFHGILVGAYSVFIEGNVINNIVASAIVLYSVEYAKITGNYIQSGGIHLNGSGLAGKVAITDNYLNSLNIDNKDYSVIATGNHISGSCDIGDSMFKNNWITPKDNITLGGKTFESNFFDAHKDSKKNPEIIIVDIEEEMTFDDCEIRNIDITNNARTGKLSFNDCKVVNSNFISSSLSTEDFEFVVSNSEIVDTLTTLRSSNKKNSLQPKFMNSTFIITPEFKSSSIFKAYCLTYSKEKNIFNTVIKNCTFNFDKERMAIYSHNYGYDDQTSLKFINNSMQHIGENAANVEIVDNVGRLYSVVVDNNKLDNVKVLDVLSNPKFTLYDVTRKGIQPPKTGYFNVGDIYYNAEIKSGGYIGWVAMSSGYANEIEFRPYGLIS